MPQENHTPEGQYQHFISRARETGEVWGLKSADGWAYCESSEFEDTDVLVFWSEEESARLHAKGDWSGHKPTMISVEEFIDRWLLGMHQDSALVGPNWNAALEGLEVEPQDVAEDLTSEDSEE